MFETIKGIKKGDKIYPRFTSFTNHFLNDRQFRIDYINANGGYGYLVCKAGEKKPYIHKDDTHNGIEPHYYFFTSRGFQIVTTTDGTVITVCFVKLSQYQKYGLTITAETETAITKNRAFQKQYEKTHGKK